MMSDQHQVSVVPGHGGIQLFAQRWRPEHPRGVVALVHGLGEHSGRYQHLVGRLTGSGLAVYACDHRGHGHSPGRRGHVDTWEDLRAGVSALVAWASASELGVPMFLYGHSLGGLIALDYALRNQDRLRGVIASAPGLSSDGLSPALVLISRLLSRIAPTLPLKTGLPVVGISRDPAVQAAYVGDPLNHMVATPRLATESFKTIAWVNAHAGDLQLPLLVVHGAADPIVPPVASAQFYDRVGSTDKRRITYPDMVHEPHNDWGWERPVSDVAEWLDAHLS